MTVTPPRYRKGILSAYTFFNTDINTFQNWPLVSNKETAEIAEVPLKVCFLTLRLKLSFFQWRIIGDEKILILNTYHRSIDKFVAYLSEP